MKSFFFTLSLLYVLPAISSSTSSKMSTEADIKPYIDRLSQKLASHYWGKNQKRIFPFLWERKKGLYGSTVRMNYVDKRNGRFAQFMRQKIFKIDDMNMFVTSFVLYGLLQAKELDTISLNEHQFSQSLMAINDFRDKNAPQGVPEYIFWEQTKVNGTWSAFPTNLIYTVDKLVPDNISPRMSDFLEAIGLGFVVTASTAKTSFVIPPDNDDSSVNLALLGFLKETNSSHYPFWNSLNYKKNEFYARALKYAYRPFGPNITLNQWADQIDPRTYYIIRGFLDQVNEKALAKNETPSLILPTTWLMTKNESIKKIQKMPFDTNNVDASVCANFLFGLVYQLIENPQQVTLTKELEQMMLDTSKLLAYTVHNLIQVRPDLILVYYPSKYDFYWFVARIVHLLKRQKSLIEPLNQVKSELESVMKEKGTSHLLSKVIEKKNVCHWNEFIGNYAGKTRDDDAIFSTAVALNALLDIWTTRKGKDVKYNVETPDKVKEVIKKGISYLTQQLSKKRYSQMNAFFSGSVKVFPTIPFFFPANIHRSNGTDFDPQGDTSKVDFHALDYFAKGYIEKDEYEKYLKLKWFGVKVPQKFEDYNSQLGVTFPFWSSAAVTQIYCITSLSKYLRLADS